jgi:hypothetical protein
MKKYKPTPTTTDDSRSWDAIVSDQEILTAEMRAKVDGDAVDPPDPPDPPDGEVIVVGDDLVGAIKAAAPGSVLDLGGKTYGTPIRIDKPLTLQNGLIQAPVNCNDLVGLYGENITLRNLTIRGDNETTKRGISNQAKNTILDRVSVLAICREGQETQGVAMWDTPGPFLATDCHFEGGSLAFLSGGSTPTIPNTIPTGLKFERCVFTRPLEWRSRGLACKNSFELKCARDVEVIDCEISNVWAQGQSGYAIQLTPSQYGGSPETTVENVLFLRCNIHDAAAGVNLLGYTQHDDADRQTQRGGNYRFEACTFNVAKKYDGNGTAFTCAHSPHDVAIVDCDVTADGDAFLRVSDKAPIDNFEFAGGRVDVAGTYGVFSPLGNRGAAWESIAPGGTIEGVVFINAHSTFKNNFPENTFETAPVALSLALTDRERERLEELAIDADVSLADAIVRALQGV